MYWEFSTQSGQQAVRYGKWKGLKTDLQKGPQPLQLFNLEDDIKEIKNVSNENPDIVEKWRRYNLVQAAIHGDVVQVSPNLRKGVGETVKEKNNSDRFEISGFRDQLLKIAIAASVATICVLSGRVIFEDAGIGTQIADQRLITTDN